MYLHTSNKKKPLDGLIIVLVSFTFYSVYWLELYNITRHKKKPHKAALNSLYDLVLFNVLSLGAINRITPGLSDQIRHKKKP